MPKDPASQMDSGVAKKVALLRRYLDGEASLGQVAAQANTSLRTVKRWLARYRKGGPAALSRRQRSDAGVRRLNGEVITLVERLALTRPRLSVATIHRRVVAAQEQRNPPPSYSSVYAVVRKMDPAMLMLAHEGVAAFRDHYELVFRHRAKQPNALWLADHTQLDLLILDANGAEVRPWLTTILDDYSRAVMGYMVFIGAPSALNTSLALRQAIWRKQRPEWPVCGIPDVLHVDHDADFTSLHLEQAAADLRMQLVYSTVARPQGRGKIERLFRTFNTELLPELPGNLVQGKPTSRPRLSLAELDAVIGAFVVNTYNQRPHQEIGQAPIEAWRGRGWLPRMPENLEALDTLLVMVAKPRVVHRDGIHFEGMRFLDPTLAAFVGESVTVRYDPRDVGEVRVFHHSRFLCRAISADCAGQSVTLKDLQAARIAHRRHLRRQLEDKTASPQADKRPEPPQNAPCTIQAEPALRTRLRIYTQGS
jgi:putative transposase